MAESKSCAKCGAKNPISNNFCEQCGAKMAAAPEKILKASPAAGGGKSPKPSDPAKDRVHAPAPNDGMVLNWRWVVFAVLLLVTVFTRFDHLGAKPHHHDESMHSFYSWQLYEKGDYEYNPMMHGPFQFHGNSLMYYLFGVSDASSRYLAATFGLLTVILAMMMGSLIGRTGSLLATLLIVISPSFMYFDRFTREDAYIAGATFMMVVFLMKYYQTNKPLDFWLASLGFAIAFCTKESIFITIATIGTYLFIRLLPWNEVFVAAGLTMAGLASQLAIAKTPENSNTRLALLGLFAGAAFAYTIWRLIIHWLNGLKSGAENPMWQAVFDLEMQKVKWEIVALFGWFILSMMAVKIPLMNSGSGYVLSLLLALSWIGLILRFGWLWMQDEAPAITGGVTIAAIVFTLLFTTFFTVGTTQGTFLSRIHYFVNSLYQGAFGGLEYWWQQHDVARGDEPWFYYLVQLPANEMVSFLFALVAMAWYGLFKKKNVPLFFAYWFIGHLALFSWAGEKMPWLILHPLLPALLLTAYFIGDLWENKPATQVGQIGRIFAFVVFGILATYSLHSAVGLTFYREADPVESLVYVQSGPDTMEVERWCRLISYGETGGPYYQAPDNGQDADRKLQGGIAMTIEDKCSWPFAWSLRDFKFRGHPTAVTSADNPLIMTATESDSQDYDMLTKAGYVNRKYKLRVWWVPGWFKKGYPSAPINFGLFSDWFWGNLIPLGTKRGDMVDWDDLINWILYRKVWSDLGSYNMRLWVRGDLAAKYGFTDIGRSDIPSDYPMPVTMMPKPTATAHHHSER